MNKNVNSDTTVTQEEYDTLRQERDEYREIALQLQEYIISIRGGSA